MPTEPEISDGVRLRARGVDFTVDGAPHRLVFSYEAIELVEEEFGTLQDFFVQLMAGKTKGQRFKATIWGLTASLLHEHEDELGRTEILALRRQLLRGLDSRLFDEHFEALSRAIKEGLPELRPDDPKDKGGPVHSRGKGSTASRASTSTARTESSGA